MADPNMLRIWSNAYFPQKPLKCAFCLCFCDAAISGEGVERGGERVSVQCEKQFGTRILREIPSLWEKIHL